MKRETLKRTISKILHNNINLPKTNYSDITNIIMTQVDKYVNEKAITEEQIKNQFIKKGWKYKGTSVVTSNRTKIFNFEKVTNKYKVSYLGVDFDNLINTKDFGIGLTIKANGKDEERFCITGNFKSLTDITSKIEKRISEYLNSIKH